MCVFCSLRLTLVLAALTVCRAQHTHFPRAPQDRTGVLCLNGGTSFTLSGRHIICLCPDGFSGSSCETDVSMSCSDGAGLHRGPVSVSASGRECLELGRHKHCSNPDFSRKPWCFVEKESRIIREDCDIPRCTRDLSPDITEDMTDAQSGWRCGQREERSMKVVGGALSAVELHPWMAAVFSMRSRGRAFTCGGSLISPCWILTAAHCFPNGAQTDLHKLSVVLGKNAINETDIGREQEFNVSDLFIHEHFDNTDGNYDNDIALLKIRSPSGRCAKESRSVKTVCIPGPHHSLRRGTSCEVTGYGKEREGSWYYSRYLREAAVKLLSQDLCSSKAYYSDAITDNMLCAGSPDWTADACKGDSGGPLVCRVRDRAFLFGVVSWGEGCSRPFRPGVYTKVSNYHHWILEKTGLSSLTAHTHLRT
ncbi:plasminogen activator, urokinase b [Pimephales promelas]|uniref:plasminogen activator, urokinase b n=1 Tax=Pimephales promelas TaxID=90988 RepID=UPI001955C61E|nr:plasminogen activator, urokinase b [Pimephales promelas]XP_039506288.1 plasminogen activator, urokinase b [Pimephales promelas]KAG1930398.1 urokinase-type plasminogen activator [Pimephales promelas]KAG1930399.1 urokinase-type plasminogen activator [Pimephales promelas]